MSGGYRDYRIGRRQGSIVKRSALGLGLLALLALGWWLSSRVLGAWRGLRRAAEQTQAGQLDLAERGFAALEGNRLFGAAAREGLGVVALLRGDLAASRRRFAASGESEIRFLPFDYAALTLQLLERGDHERAEALAARARSRRDSPVLRMYHGMALNGLDRLAPAREAMAGGPLRAVFERVKRGDALLLGGVFREARVLEMYTSHVRNLVEKERSSRRAYLFDGAGKPLFRILLRSGERSGPDAALRSAVGEAGEGAGEGSGIERYLDAIDRRNRVETTLEPELQRLAWESLGGYRGAFVVLGMDGSVLAAASRDHLRHKRLRGGRLDERPAPDPFATLFPVASVAKLPTLGAALSVPGTVESVFPFACRGRRSLGGQALLDARAHGEVRDYARALAVSCNLAFAELSLKLGEERLLSAFRDFGVGQAAQSPLAPLPLAALDAVPDGERELAELGVGLGGARATAVGLAAMALTVASRGEYREPRLIRQKLTIGGQVYARAEPFARRVLGEDAAERLGEAMRRVIGDEDATGRRAAHELLTLAAKTGTLGNDREGYEAMMAGFVPASSPRYAFAVYLNGTGRAEWDAAMVTKSFLDGLQALEEERARTRAGKW